MEIYSLTGVSLWFYSDGFQGQGYELLLMTSWFEGIEIKIIYLQHIITGHFFQTYIGHFILFITSKRIF
jgi:hypothetical protein